MATTLSIQVFLEQVIPGALIDLRSPAEFYQGHIPGALNIPLFDDEERRIVGTLYKQTGRNAAIQEGFKILGSKSYDFVKQLLQHSQNGTLFLYCWRGGMRSRSVGWILEQQGINIVLLKQGYKSYRRLVRQFLVQPFRLNILGGMTGTGKTAILKELKKRGHQVIDLEGLANHKGSAFGALGENPQPSQEHFENMLLFKFLSKNPQEYIWLEDESRSIGRVFIPTELFDQMKRARLFFLDMPQKGRIDRLVEDYSYFPQEELMESLLKIGRKIGGQHIQPAREALEKKDFRTFASIALKYYDKAYRHGISDHNPDQVIHIETDTTSPEQNAQLIEKIAKENTHGI